LLVTKAEPLRRLRVSVSNASRPPPRPGRLAAGGARPCPGPGRHRAHLRHVAASRGFESVVLPDCGITAEGRRNDRTTWSCRPILLEPDDGSAVLACRCRDPPGGVPGKTTSRRGRCGCRWRRRTCGAGRLCLGTGWGAADPPRGGPSPATRSTGGVRANVRSILKMKML
jgi:hypothetical protein